MSVEQVILITCGSGYLEAFTKMFGNERVAMTYDIPYWHEQGPNYITSN